ncbi:MAG TPA: tetratricopeptide repeat protein [Bryobacteraceae bacterium]|nr:tetratricopeptide repeat protein [Bryobacteraceae bacterium]
MKRLILTGILALATGISCLMAQQPPAAPAKPAAKGPTPKSQAEVQVLNEMFTAANAGNQDGVIKASEDLQSKFADSDFKETALTLEAQAYKQKGDNVKAQIYGERVLEINPNSFQITLMLGEILAMTTRENDLDKEEKLTKADKYLNHTIDSLKTAPKPNPNLPDAQWEDAKKLLTAEAHNGLGLIGLDRKKYDVAISEFKMAIDGDPQATYSVRLASAYQQAGKNQEAIEICDKLLADPQLHPQIKSVAQSVKAAASKK